MYILNKVLLFNWVEIGDKKWDLKELAGARKRQFWAGTDWWSRWSVISIDTYSEVNRKETFSSQDFEVLYPDSTRLLCHSGEDRRTHTGGGGTPSIWLHGPAEWNFVATLKAILALGRWFMSLWRAPSANNILKSLRCILFIVL